MARKGTHLPEEMKKRISDTLKRKYKSGELISPFTYVNMGKPGYMLGKKHSEKAKLKMSINHSGGPKKGHKVLKKTRLKISKSLIEYAKNNLEYGNRGKKFPKDKYPKLGFRTSRKNIIFPVKDTSIEIKMQQLLKQLNIEFLTHQYMKILHGYQCDILIPVQKGINQKTIIECFGKYWHNFPLSREVDIQRCQELRERGWRVLVFWGNEIKVMNVEDLQNKIEVKK